MRQVDDSTLYDLGLNLKNARKRYFPRDDQRRFAARINVSRATYQKMEKGDPTISLGSYLAAARLFGLDHQINLLFVPPKEKTDLLKELDL